MYIFAWIGLVFGVVNIMLGFIDGNLFAGLGWLASSFFAAALLKP